MVRTFPPKPLDKYQEEHNLKVKRLLEDQKLLFKGDVKNDEG
jgi:hypothetical protein